MRPYTLTLRSGVIVLVSARSAQAAEASWDADVASGTAEPRMMGTTERASRADVRACVEAGQDYR